VITCGIPTANSYPSRRICSMRMAIWSSPRPKTRNRSATLGLLDAHGEVGLGLLEEAVAEVPARDVLPLAPGEGGVVDAELHRERGLVDRAA
jgi:hypothetical protein